MVTPRDGSAPPVGILIKGHSSFETRGPKGDAYVYTYAYFYATTTHLCNSRDAIYQSKLKLF
jgi:hypothetical protein